MRSDRRRSARALAGPFLILAALLLAVVPRLSPAASLDALAWWIAYGPMAPERALPICAFGVALALTGRRSAAAATSSFAFGAVSGFAMEPQWLDLLGRLPAAATHDFYAGPLSCIAAGASLICGRRLRPFMLVPSGFLLGAMWALWIRLLDPTLHEPKITMTGLLVAALLAAAVAITLARFRGPWMFVAAPILGSWLVAIGLLYGGAYIAARSPALVLPPPAASADPDPALLDGLFGTPADTRQHPATRRDPFGSGGGSKPF
ncbi:hypothetical protein E3C22_05530 [Jiella endophytica]|uniref:Uncharacterized protein n=1 Tax=Jiella endophytica TaxID=2558362 RepID=A0A4Y8RPZ9_9HYPH|nr:hypothetical protein [Jiella endophytica]TFF24854.1 hypothetical protein E3C22_05530 [Jiella endophytica]